MNHMKHVKTESFIRNCHHAWKLSRAHPDTKFESSSKKVHLEQSGFAALMLSNPRWQLVAVSLTGIWHSDEMFMTLSGSPWRPAMQGAFPPPKNRDNNANKPSNPRPDSKSVVVLLPVWTEKGYVCPCDCMSVCLSVRLSLRVIMHATLV